MFPRGRYGGKTVEEVSRLDPAYLRFMRRKQTLFVEPGVIEGIDAIMVKNGVPFEIPKKRGKK
jgi:hypothetical protein